MKITIQTFALLKDKLGKELIVEIPENSQIQDLLKVISESRPEIKNLLPSCMVAVNETMVNKEEVLFEGQVVLLMPPASGG